MILCCFRWLKLVTYVLPLSIPSKDWFNTCIIFTQMQNLSVKNVRESIWVRKQGKSIWMKKHARRLKVIWLRIPRKWRNMQVGVFIIKWRFLFYFNIVVWWICFLLNHIKFIFKLHVIHLIDNQIIYKYIKLCVFF